MRSILILLLFASFRAPADEKSAAAKSAAELVKQLGNTRYAVREAAARQLMELGPDAVPALEQGTKATDQEVRNRCVALLPQAKAAEWKHRSAAYLADTSGKQKHELPLLADWEKLIGKPDAGSRKLFAEMIRADGEFLQTVATDRKNAAKACLDRCKIVLAQVRTAKGQIKADLGDIAAILFVDTLAPVRYDWSNSTFPAHLLNNPSTMDAITAADTGPITRRLLLKWAGVRPEHDSYAFQRFACLVQKKPFPEAAAYLAKTARNKKADVLSMRLLAVQALGKVGGKIASETLAELVADTSPLFGGSPEQYRLGDSALAASLTLHGKKLSDYGLTANGGIGFSTGDGEEIISLQLHGFTTVDGREKAIKKWKEEVVEKKKRATKK